MAKKEDVSTLEWSDEELENLINALSFFIDQYPSKGSMITKGEMHEMKIKVTIP